MQKIIHLQNSKHNASLWTVQNFITKEEANILFQLCSDPEFPLEADPKVIVYGKECTSHRRVGFFSDIAAGYPFAGQVAKALPLEEHKEINNLLKKINNYLETKFNGILINDYRNGEDSIGAHADNEKTLSCGVVAGVSVGASRIFRIRDKKTKEIIMDIETKHGQLLVMDGNFQTYYTHEIPMQKKILGGRVSYTCRVHDPKK